MDPLRCLITENPCGTDTWKVGYSCQCINCQKWLQSEKRIELIKKKITSGLTLTEAHELAILETLNLVPWKHCEKHESKFLYGFKCPNCLE